MEYAEALKEIDAIFSKKSVSHALQQVVDFLQQQFPHYSWVGLYFIKNDTLVLGPWRGREPTEHTRIPLGRGVCGSAAQSGTTEIVDDVSKDARYLSCFLSTRSEIVVPIKKDGKVIGEIDIDSDKRAAFDAKDAAFLQKVAVSLSKHLT
jgi:putative methionine-R-sulfoxide reductase with GAF domain